GSAAGCCWRLGDGFCDIHHSHSGAAETPHVRPALVLCQPTFALMARHRDGDKAIGGEVRMLTLSNTSLTRATKVADVPLIGLGLSLLFMAAIIAVAFIACAGLQ